MNVLIFAILVATAPGQQPDNLAVFLTEDGPELCAAFAEALNSGSTDVLFVCEVKHG